MQSPIVLIKPYQLSLIIKNILDDVIGTILKPLYNTNNKIIKTFISPLSLLYLFGMHRFYSRRDIPVQKIKVEKPVLKLSFS